MGALPTIEPRPCWTDKFSTPTIDRLMQEMDASVRGAVGVVRTELSSLRGVREHLCWMGIPWRWSLAYRTRGKGSQAIAYVICDPVRPWASIPMTAEQVCGLPWEHLSRAQRDAILDGTKVGPQVWASFVIGSESDAAEVTGLVARKLAVHAEVP